MALYHGQVLQISRPLHNHQLVIRTVTSGPDRDQRVRLLNEPLCTIRVSPRELEEAQRTSAPLAAAFGQPLPAFDVGSWVYFEALAIDVWDGEPVHDVIRFGVPLNFSLSSCTLPLPQSIPGWPLADRGIAQMVAEAI